MAYSGGKHRAAKPDSISLHVVSDDLRLNGLWLWSNVNEQQVRSLCMFEDIHVHGMQY